MMTSELQIASPPNDLRGYTWWGPSASFTALLTPNSMLQDTMGNGGCNAVTPAVQHRRSPTRWRLRDGLPGGAGYHPGGVNVGMCDGSVRFIKNTVNPLSYRG